MERPVVGLWSDPSALSISLVEKLLANFCSIIVFSQKVKDWKPVTSHIRDTSHFLIEEKETEPRTLDYALIVNISVEDNLAAKLKEADQIEERHKGKTLLIVSYRQLFETHRVFTVPGNVGVVYVGDLFGPRMNLDEESPLSRMIKDVLAKKPVGVSKEELIFPTPISDAANLVVRWLFSFGPYGREVMISSREISTIDFYKEIEKVANNTTVVLKEYKSQIFQKNVERYILEVDITAYLKETIEWFIKYQPKKEGEPKKREEQSRFRIWLPIIIVIFLLVSPFLILAISLASLSLGWAAATTGRFGVSKDLLIVGEGISEISHRESLILSSIPFLGKIYRPAAFFSEALVRVGRIGEEAANVFENSKQLSNKILGSDTYDPLPYLERIGLGLDNIYQELSFLQGEFSPGSGIEKKLNIKDAKNTALALRALVSRFPEILGVEKKKTYLFLLQNNMELRPTGGFIGSYALVTFESGKLSNISVSDVYSADGQLKGHVEPPAPIKKYLGEAGWYLRDANWDPDFPTSAGKIEWFLDKEIDASVDGVVAVDLEVAKFLLKETGPITISDFGTTIDDKNIYEKTQSEVQEGFFPGSSKKANFLTALTRELLNEISHPKGRDYVQLAKAIYTGLTQRHIQIFLHDSVGQKSIEDLGWDGAVANPTCLGNCLPDWLGIIEANVGVNKANYFIKREASLEVFFDGGVVRKRLTLSFNNGASPALLQSGRYKVYLRLEGPTSTNFGNVLVSGSNGDISVPPEVDQVHGRKEAGVYFEVPGSTRKRVTFTWTNTNTLNFREAGEYQLYWRKQAGTSNDNISVTVHLPTGVFGYAQPEPSLTRGENFGYNTTLAKDFMARIFW